MTWAEDYGDLDLHYIGPGGTLYETTPDKGDLDWSYSHASAYGMETPTLNCGSVLPPCASLDPDWGLNDTVAPDGLAANNPALLLDQRWGYGPELAVHAEPFAGTYQIAVHYYCEADESGIGNPTPYGPATPKIEVYVDGALQWSMVGPQLTEEQVWDAAQVVVSKADGGISVDVVPQTTPPFTISQGCHSI